MGKRQPTHSNQTCSWHERCLPALCCSTLDGTPKSWYQIFQGFGRPLVRLYVEGHMILALVHFVLEFYGTITGALWRHLAHRHSNNRNHSRSFVPLKMALVHDCPLERRQEPLIRDERPWWLTFDQVSSMRVHHEMMTKLSSFPFYAQTGHWY